MDFQKSSSPAFKGARILASSCGLAVAGLLGSAVSAKGAIIVEYEFTGATLAPTTSANGVTTAALTTSGVSGGAGSGFISDGAVTPSGDNQYSQTGFDDAVSYFSFIIQPQEGVTLNLTNLEFYQRLGSTGTNRVYDLQFRVGATGEFTTLVNDQNASTTTYTLRAAPLGGVTELQNLTSANPVEFRIVPTLAGADATTFRIDDLKLEGTVIPEPASLSLIAGAVALCSLRRRRCSH